MNKALLIVNFGKELEKTNLLDTKQRVEVTKILAHSLAECDQQEATLLSAIFVGSLSEKHRNEIVNSMDAMHNNFMTMLREEIKDDVEKRKHFEEMSRFFEGL